jgi:protein-S-isoprenylcysteine O-methyltransferase Ste14
MYVAVLLILWGWALGYRSWPLAVYAVVVMVAFHLRVVLNAEPFLARTHGAQWTDYKRRVPRWFGRPRPPEGRLQPGHSDNPRPGDHE